MEKREASYTVGVKVNCYSHQDEWYGGSLKTKKSYHMILGNECVKAVYYHPSYLTYMQSISCKVTG